MNCYYHPNRAAIGKCKLCSTPVCTHCSLEIDNNLICKNCIVKQMNNLKKDVQTKQRTSKFTIIIVLIIIVIALIGSSFAISNFIFAPGLQKDESTEQIYRKDLIIGGWRCTINDNITSKMVRIDFMFMEDGKCFYNNYFLGDNEFFISDKSGAHYGIWDRIGSHYIVNFNENPFRINTAYIIIAYFDDQKKSLVMKLLYTNDTQIYMLEKN